jgi:small subunit ribosomal protein S16
MAVSIRLKRIGGTNDPCYRVVVADSRTARSGKSIERVGTYDPRKKDHNFEINLARVDHWLKCGAQPTETVAAIIRRARRQAAAQPAAVEGAAAPAA